MKRLTIAAVLLALSASACASEPEGGQKPAGESPAAQAPVTLEGKVDNRGVEDLTASGGNVSFEMDSDDNYFDPTFVKVMPGATVQVEVIQTGQAPHTFTIDSLSVDVTTNQKGEKKTASFTLPNSGPVVFYCRFHKDLGMQGAFYFE